jgi:membrane protease YdiL (CAAX protease family)
LVVSWTRFLVGFAALVAVLLATSAQDASGRWGLAILAAVLLTGLAVERWLGGPGLRGALCRLGFGRPGGRALLVAVLVSVLVLVVYPVSATITGSVPTLRPDWPWLLVGIFAFHGLAEELVWRGFAFRRLREGRSFGAAVLRTMPLVAAVHLPILIGSGPLVGMAALAVAAVTALPLAYLFETGRNTVSAPAVVHTAIDSFKLVELAPAVTPVFSLLLAGVSVVVPLLALLVPRRVLQSG